MKDRGGQREKGTCRSMAPSMVESMILARTRMALARYRSSREFMSYCIYWEDAVVRVVGRLAGWQTHTHTDRQTDRQTG